MKLLCVSTLLLLAAKQVLTSPLPDTDSPQTGDDFDGFQVSSVEKVGRSTLTWYNKIEHHGAEQVDDANEKREPQGLGEFLNGLEPAIDAATAKKNCGKRTVRCDGHHRAHVTVCNGLLRMLVGNTTVLPLEPRAVCLNYKNMMPQDTSTEDHTIFGPDERCCVSWANSARVGMFSQLAEGTKAIMDNCVRNDPTGTAYPWPVGGMDMDIVEPTEGISFSGMVHNMNFGTVCTTQCLSNRPRECS